MYISRNDVKVKCIYRCIRFEGSRFFWNRGRFYRPGNEYIQYIYREKRWSFVVESEKFSNQESFLYYQPTNLLHRHPRARRRWMRGMARFAITEPNLSKSERFSVIKKTSFTIAIQLAFSCVPISFYATTKCILNNVQKKTNFYTQASSLCVFEFQYTLDE